MEVGSLLRDAGLCLCIALLYAGEGLCCAVWIFVSVVLCIFCAWWVSVTWPVLCNVVFRDGDGGLCCLTRVLACVAALKRRAHAHGV